MVDRSFGDEDPPEPKREPAESDDWLPESEPEPEPESEDDSEEDDDEEDDDDESEEEDDSEEEDEDVEVVRYRFAFACGSGGDCRVRFLRASSRSADSSVIGVGVETSGWKSNNPLA